MSDNTLNKALGIMGCDSLWRRRLRARLPLDRVDLAQRVPLKACEHYLADERAVQGEALRSRLLRFGWGGSGAKLVQ
jgi:hypothetical protein